MVMSAAGAAQIRSAAENFRRADCIRPRMLMERGPHEAWRCPMGAMPGLPKAPSAEKIDVDENGVISGLF